MKGSKMIGVLDIPGRIWDANEKEYRQCLSVTLRKMTPYVCVMDEPKHYVDEYICMKRVYFYLSDDIEIVEGDNDDDDDDDDA